MKWNESGFRPPLCTYRLNWARRTSWGWWDDWDDTVLQTQDSKFEPWRSEAEHATSRSRRLPTILTFTRGWGRNNFVSFKPPRPGTEPRTLAWKAAVLTTTLGPPPKWRPSTSYWLHPVLCCLWVGIISQCCGCGGDPLQPEACWGFPGNPMTLQSRDEYLNGMRLVLISVAVKISRFCQQNVRPGYVIASALRAMGKAASKLTSSELKELMTATYCEYIYI